MSPAHHPRQDSAATAGRPIKKMKQKQQNNSSHSNMHTYKQPIILDDDQSPFPPPPPPRKDKHKKQHQKDNKKKRARDEADDAETRRAAASASTSSSSARSKAAVGPDTEADNEEDEDEADNFMRAINDDGEADDEHDLSKHTKKKFKKSSAPSSTTTSAAGSPVKNKTGRLVLRLPRSKGFGPSTKTHNNKNTSPIRNTARHPSSSLARTVTSSPQSSSSELSEVNLDDLPEETIAEFALDAPAQHHSVHFAPYDSESSDGYSDLLEDDEDDLLEAEEAYLIADKLHRQGRSRKGTTSPGAKRTSDGAHSDAESLEFIGADGQHSHYPIDAESVLFEIAQLREGTTTSEAEADSAREVAVTWSGAEDNDNLDDLDEFLGITTDDAAALRSMQHDPSATSEETDEGKTMRFEDFLGQDDGSDSAGSSSTEEEESSSDDEENSVAATGTDVADRDEDEDLETTRDVVKKGGFVFFKASHDDDETESECDLPEDLEDDGGDTTDTLDDTDHLGMIRFGIEAAESDDEDAEEALANIIRDRNLIDAHNMGLSVSIEALAEQPEAVVAKTARSLGISTETAAKILTSVGMSLLMRSDGHSRDVFVEPRPSTSAISDEASKQQQESRVVQSSASGPIPSTSAQPATSVAQPANNNVNKTFEPVLGDFAPAGEADFCVVVGASDAPAPSPFSARKRRTRSSTRGFAHPSPIGRGQSVASTMSSTSAASARRYPHSNSSEEPQYNFILELDDLVDPSMLPAGMSSVSEEEEDLDDAASVGTALNVGTSAGNNGSVGDVSRWNRIPIGAFRSQNPTEFASLANVVFSGTRDPNAARDLSFHGEVTFAGDGNKRKSSRYIPVSPVLFPVGQTFKTLAAVKSRKDRRKDKKTSREGRSRKVKLENGQTSGTNHTSRPTSSRRSSNTNENLLRLPQGHHNSLPSDGLSHHVSPLFSGVASGISIPPLSLS